MAVASTGSAPAPARYWYSDRVPNVPEHPVEAGRAGRCNGTRGWGPARAGPGLGPRCIKPHRPSAPRSLCARFTMTTSAVSLLALAAVAVVLLAASPSAAAPQNNLGRGDITQYLMDPQLVRSTLACVKDQGPCSRTAKSIKGVIPRLLNNCDGCDPKQAMNARKLVDFLQRNYPRDYAEIVAKYRSAPVVRSG